MTLLTKNNIKLKNNKKWNIKDKKNFNAIL